MRVLSVQLPGNKMDAHNLATLFGPNILHKAKGGTLQFQVESQERAEERREIIEVVQEMIEHQSEVFAVGLSVADALPFTVFFSKFVKCNANERASDRPIKRTCRIVVHQGRRFRDASTT